MKTLIIHPDDRTTDFLKPIYQNIKNKTVITHGKSKQEIKDLMKSHNRIMMMGHGVPSGLLRTRQDWGEGVNGLVVDSSMADILKERECVFIWCNADWFVRGYNLKGFFSGMFCSEIDECLYNGFGTTQDLVDESNNVFSQIVSKYINEGIHTMYEKVMEEYSLFAIDNKVAEFNSKRLYLL